MEIWGINLPGKGVMLVFPQMDPTNSHSFLFGRSDPRGPPAKSRLWKLAVEPLATKQTGDSSAIGIRRMPQRGAGHKAHSCTWASEGRWIGHMPAPGCVRGGAEQGRGGTGGHLLCSSFWSPGIFSGFRST